MLATRLKSIKSIRNYNVNIFKNDLLAGITLFVMLIPQGMAYAMLAGLPPVMGLYAATIPLIIYAIFSSSRHLSIGPVAITSLLVFSGVSLYAEPGSQNYISLVVLLTIMVGVIQLILGIFKAGFIIKFIPHSVMNGYTSAAAIVIGISQLKHLLGIETGNHLQIHILLKDVVKNINEINIIAILIGLCSIAGLVFIKKMNPRIPAALFIVVMSSIAVYFLRLDQSGLKIVGDIPEGFPLFNLPSITFESIKMLFPIALTISLLGFMESIAIGSAIARKEKYKIDANKELRALGLSNAIGACFNAFPINGSFSRTAVNHQSGGVTQVTSIITAIFVSITLLLFTSFFYYLPNAALAAIIMVAVVKLVDIKEMKHLFAVKPLEGWVWVGTFLTTLFIGIQWGIILGAIFTLMLIIRKSAQPNIVEIGYLEEDSTYRDISRYPNANTSEEVLMIRIDSALHFANIAFLEEKVKDLLRKKGKTKWIIIDMSGVNDIDTISVDRLEEMMNNYQKKHEITILFTHMKGTVRDTVNKVGWDRKYKEQFSYPIDKLLREKGIIPFIRLDYYL